MANYTDKGLQGSQSRRFILNSGDVNTLNSAHTFKATTEVGGLKVTDSIHTNGVSDGDAGKITATRGDGATVIDGQEIRVSRTGGSTWNRLTLRGNDPTSSVVQFNHGTSNTQIGESGIEGFRLGFCAVSAHTNSVASGGLANPRNDSFFLQAGNGATITNILDVALSDGEVYFYKGLRNTDTSGRIKISGHTIEIYNSATLSDNDSVSILNFKGDNDGGTTKTFASLTAKAKDVGEDLESGQIDLNVLGTAGSLVALSVYSVGSSDAVVKISNTWTLPTDSGSDGQVLTTNGSGTTSWADKTALSDTLDSVTGRGASTSNALTTGNLLPNAGTNTLGSSSSVWQDLYLKSGGKIYFGASDISLDSVAGVGLVLNMSSEGNTEPTLTLKSTEASNTTGPTLDLQTDATVSTDEVVGQIKFTGKDSGGSTLVSYGVIESCASDTTASSTDGSIKLKVPVNGTETTGLEIYSGAVKISDAWTLPSSNGSAGQLLQANSNGTATWVNAPSEVNLGNESVGELNDVTLSTLSVSNAGQVLRYSGSAFVNATLAYSDLSGLPTLGTSASLDTGTNTDNVVKLVSSGLPAVSGVNLTALPSIDKLSDVDITSVAPTSGQSLVWDGTSKFVPGDVTSYTDEEARDAVANALISGNTSDGSGGVDSVTFAHDDTANEISLSLSVSTANLTDVDSTAPSNGQVLQFTTDSSLNKYKPVSLGTASTKDTGTTSGSVPVISDHYLSSTVAIESGDLIIFGRVLETIDYGSVATTFVEGTHFEVDFGSITDTLIYCEEDYGCLVV